MQVSKGRTLVILPLRFAVYLCLSIALIFLTGFLQTKQTVYTEEEALFFTRHDKPEQQIKPHIYEEQCGSTAVQIKPEHKLDLQLLKNSSRFPVSAWQEINHKMFQGKQDNLCFVEKGIVFSVSVEKDSSYSALNTLVIVNLSKLGAHDPPAQYPVIQLNQLQQYSSIATVLNEIEQRMDPDCIRLSYEPVAIDLNDWRIFTGSISGLQYQETFFVFGDHLYKAAVATDYHQHEEEIQGLKQKFIITGIVLLVVGLALMTRLYRSVKGIKLVPNSLVFVIDWVIIIILAVLGFMAFDHLLAEQYGTSSILGRDGMLGAFTYVPIIIVMPIVVSWKSARGILINEQGILDSDLILRTFMPWDELRSMELMDDVEFSGLRRSFKVLFLHAVDDNAITISGNIRQQAKKEIVSQLMKYVPENKKHEMKMHLSSL